MAADPSPHTDGQYRRRSERAQRTEQQKDSERPGGDSLAVAPLSTPLSLHLLKNHASSLRASYNQATRIDAFRHAQQTFGNRAVQKITQPGIQPALQLPGQQGPEQAANSLLNHSAIMSNAPGDVPTNVSPHSLPRVSVSHPIPVQRYCGHPDCKDPNCKDPTKHEKVQATQGCGTPNCKDPNCRDPSVHGFDRVIDLREGALYSSTVNPSDVGTGTNTNKTTRDSVNSEEVTYPQEVRMSFSGPTKEGYTEFENAPLEKSQKADAGHIRSKQTGGLGDDTASVFPQNPQQNEGHLLHRERTHEQWRGPEDEIRHEAEKGPVQVSTIIREEPRQRYSSSQGTPSFPDDSLTQYIEQATSIGTGKDEGYIPEEEEEDEEEEEKDKGNSS